ncbi:DUF4376 domain-containing protein [Bosea sp. UC22_33]|uniref:DUF4376 domain-containing protein n=1 Tax=Bosea sp. UC22_33 TaxID=3350165 RepID=UPI00366B785C
MTYFAAYDQSGRVTGYYPEDREPEGDFLTLTDEEWQAAIVLTDAHVENGAIVSRPPSIDLAAYAAQARFRKESGGISLSGQAVATDRESQALISGAFALVQQQPETTIRFKTPSGFVTLNSTQMSAIAIAVAEHVQACFALEADVAGDIASGEITTTAEIDAAFGS